MLAVHSGEPNIRSPAPLLAHDVMFAHGSLPATCSAITGICDQLHRNPRRGDVMGLADPNSIVLPYALAILRSVEFVDTPTTEPVGS
jgi:hypothetical protein